MAIRTATGMEAVMAASSSRDDGYGCGAGNSCDHDYSDDTGGHGSGDGRSDGYGSGNGKGSGCGSISGHG